MIFKVIFSGKKQGQNKMLNASHNSYVALSEESFLLRENNFWSNIFILAFSLLIASLLALRVSREYPNFFSKINSNNIININSKNINTNIYTDINTLINQEIKQKVENAVESAVAETEEKERKSEKIISAYKPESKINYINNLNNQDIKHILSINNIPESSLELKAENQENINNNSVFISKAETPEVAENVKTVSNTSSLEVKAENQENNNINNINSNKFEAISLTDETESDNNTLNITSKRESLNNNLNNNSSYSIVNKNGYKKFAVFKNKLEKNQESLAFKLGNLKKEKLSLNNHQSYSELFKKQSDNFEQAKASSDADANQDLKLIIIDYSKINSKTNKK